MTLFNSALGAADPALIDDEAIEVAKRFFIQHTEVDLSRFSKPYIIRYEKIVGIGFSVESVATADLLFNAGPDATATVFILPETMRPIGYAGPNDLFVQKDMGPLSSTEAEVVAAFICKSMTPDICVKSEEFFGKYSANKRSIGQMTIVFVLPETPAGQIGVIGGGYLVYLSSSGEVLGGESTF